ncbi:MAG: SIR2 family protein [Erysipelotrichaceae bacterium]|nr:SIR2 family protein [Erysipelotrichaceae bacterium]
MAKGNCLLIGNGLNQCLQGGVPWGDLLRAIAEECDVTYNKDIAMPLEFERIVNTYLKTLEKPSREVYSKLKRKVADKVLNATIQEDAPHLKLVELPIDSIITTNYDYLLEQAFDRNFKPEGPKGNNTKTLEETYEVGNIHFYHAHGEAKKWNTICLGYDHYISIVNDNCGFISTKSDKSTENILRKLKGDLDFKNVWAEKFFTSNIGIIGLGMYECEIDLWWLLTHRASLINSNYEDCRSLIDNCIVYYDVVDDIVQEGDREQSRLARLATQRNKHDLLEGTNVMVKKYYLSRFNGSYKGAYLQMMDDIKENGIESV